MKYLFLLTFALAGSTSGLALPAATPDLATIADRKAWKIVHATAEAVDMDGRRAVRLKAEGDSANRFIGQALPSGVEFATGMIEVDLKGRNIRQQSFLGVVFNVDDERTFEAVYFRPFNFRAEEPFRSRAVQYIAWPENTWDKLRQATPGRYENRVDPVPDPECWFHARIEIVETQVKVYVDGASAPCLVVDRLNRGDCARPVGLWVDVAEGLYANLVVIPDAD